jgi:putative SOS response-associated peptidase YedK
MPVIIPPEAWEEWLRPGQAQGILDELLVPAPDDLLEAHPVGTTVNNAANDGAHLILPQTVQA